MSWFKRNGTKALGSATAAIGVLSAVEPAVLTTILGPQGPSYVMAAAGILTLLRGFQNTANINAQNPPVIR